MSSAVALAEITGLNAWAPLLTAFVALLGGLLIAVWTQQAVHRNTLRRERVSNLREEYAAFAALGFEFIDLQDEILRFEIQGIEAARAVEGLQAGVDDEAIRSARSLDNSATEAIAKALPRLLELEPKIRQVKNRIFLLAGSRAEQDAIDQREHWLLHYEQSIDSLATPGVDVLLDIPRFARMRSEWEVARHQLTQWLRTMGQRLAE